VLHCAQVSSTYGSAPKRPANMKGSSRTKDVTSKKKEFNGIFNANLGQSRIEAEIVTATRGKLSCAGETLPWLGAGKKHQIAHAYMPNPLQELSRLLNNYLESRHHGVATAPTIQNNMLSTRVRAKPIEKPSVEFQTICLATKRHNGYSPSLR
jgi:hypothetical protein